jgi:hypothetical protein
MDIADPTKFRPFELYHSDAEGGGPSPLGFGKRLGRWSNRRQGDSIGRFWLPIAR